jgi:hypothetical protein
MSEYRYYEWQTLGRPLTVEEQTEVDIARLAGLQAQYPKRPSMLERLRRVAEGK